MNELTEKTALPGARLAVPRRRLQAVPLERVAVGLEQPHVVLERRAVRVVAAERRRRLRAPRREPRRDPARHEEVEPLDRARDRLVDRREPERLRHLDAGDEVRDHVARAEHLRRVEDPPVPLRPPDVALLARADDREEARVPDLVVRVVDRDPVVLVALHVLARERLRDHLADPAAGEALLDRLRVPPVEVRLREPVDLRRHRAAGERVRVRGPVVVLGDDRERLEHVLDRLDPRCTAGRPACAGASCG